VSWRQKRNNLARFPEAFGAGRAAGTIRSMVASPAQRPCRPLKSAGQFDCACFAKEFSMSSADASPPTGPTPQELKSALKAFRKRLKLTQLDDQSRLGYGPMTGGHQSGIVAITPPDQFPPAVWEELARQGKLKRAGSGTYALGQP